LLFSLSPSHRRRSGRTDDLALEHQHQDDHDGTVTMTEAAMMMPHGISYCEPPDSNAMATGTVRVSLDEVNVRANRNSFQAPMKASRPVVTSAGHINGMNTRVMITQGLAHRRWLLPRSRSAGHA
jgi:hypothetical protein